MNDQITIARFASALAKSTGYRQEFCEQFIHEMFRTVEEGLKEDRIVKIKGLGTFILTDEGSVRFAADQNVADIVNEPFSFFEPEELADDITEEILADGIEQTTEQVSEETDSVNIGESEVLSEGPDEDEENAETTNEVIQPQEEENDTTATPAATSSDIAVTAGDSVDPKPEDDIENKADEDPGTETVQEPVSDETVDNDDFADQPYEPSHKKRYSFAALLIAALVGILIGAAGTFLLYPALSDSIRCVETTIEDNETTSEETQNDVIVEPEETEPQTIPVDTPSSADNTSENDKTEETADEIITETVNAANYLATMARRHYGRYEFWVYIYEENSGILDHPDRIEPNTTVVIPPAEKYGIDKNDPSSIKKAEALAKEIYARFKR